MKAKKKVEVLNMSDEERMTVVDAREMLQIMNDCCKGLLFTKDEISQIATIALKAIERAKVRNENMGDLISRKALLEEINSYQYDTCSLDMRRAEHIVRAHFTELIDNQPTAFDLESVIGQIEAEEKRLLIEMDELMQKNTDIPNGVIFSGYNLVTVLLANIREFLNSIANG